MGRKGRLRVSSLDFDRVGAFSLSGPATVLATSEEELRALMRANFPAVSVWFHGTNRAAAASAAWQGLVPSCWCGGDNCCVFGEAHRAAVAPHHDWVIDIRSAALPGQLKAWWVPPQFIEGAWNEGHFYGPDDLRAMGGPLLRPVGCRCELAGATATQLKDWRRAVEGASASWS